MLFKKVLDRIQGAIKGVLSKQPKSKPLEKHRQIFLRKISKKNQIDFSRKTRAKLFEKFMVYFLELLVNISIKNLGIILVTFVDDFWKVLLNLLSSF